MNDFNSNDDKESLTGYNGQNTAGNGNSTASSTGDNVSGSSDGKNTTGGNFNSFGQIPDRIDTAPNNNNAAGNSASSNNGNFNGNSRNNGGSSNNGGPQNMAGGGAGTRTWSGINEKYQPRQARQAFSAPYPPQQIYYQPPQKGNGIFKTTFLFCLGVACSAGLVLFMMGFFVFLFMIGLASIASSVDTERDTPVIYEKYISGNQMAISKVVILPVEGIITGNEEGFIQKAIKTAEEDNDVCAMVLRVNSPGGTVTGSDYYYNLLKKMKANKKIPIIVSMGDLATSGGYYVSMCGDEIYAERSSWTGSIGVIVSLYNAAELAKKIGFESTPITSGAMKGMGNTFKPMSEEEKVIWKNLVDKSYGQFLEVVREGRPCFREGDGPKKLEKIADGRVYCAADAKDLKLIDKIGFLDDAVDAALKKAGKTKENCCVVKYKAQESIFEKLAIARFDGKKSAMKNAAALLTPTPYYIAPNTLPVEF